MLTLGLGRGFSSSCGHSWRKTGTGAGPCECPDFFGSNFERSQLSEVSAGGKTRLILVVDSGMAGTQASDNSFSISGSCRSPEMSLSVSVSHTPLRGTQRMGLSHLVQEPPGLATIDTYVHGQEGTDTENRSHCSPHLTVDGHSGGRSSPQGEQARTGEYGICCKYCHPKETKQYLLTASFKSPRDKPGKPGETVKATYRV